MKTMLKILSLAAVLAATAPLALADTISGDIAVAGPGTFRVTAGGIGIFTAGTATYNHQNIVNRADGTPFTDFLGATSSQIFFDNFRTDEHTPAEIFHITLASGEKLIFTATGFSGLQLPTVSSGGSVNMSGEITVIHDGSTIFAPAGGTLDFDANGQLRNFTESTSTVGYVPRLTTTPEPSSLFLLGTGLLTAVGFGRRKINA